MKNFRNEFPPGKKSSGITIQDVLGPAIIRLKLRFIKKHLHDDSVGGAAFSCKPAPESLPTLFPEWNIRSASKAEALLRTVDTATKLQIIDHKSAVSPALFAMFPIILVY
jgi:hypothetical protein